MTKLKLLFLFTICCSLAASAQNKTKTDTLTGKWKFYDVYDKKGIDSPSMKIIKEYFGNMTMYFKPNKHFKSFLMNNMDEGDWSFNENTSKIRLTSYQGHSRETDIIELSGDHLVIKMGEGAFILTRAEIVPGDDIEMVLPKIETVSVTKAQLCKKWYMMRREIPGRSEAQLKMASKLMKGAYAYFKPSGEYEAQSLKVTEHGKWVFGPDNRSIIVTIENQQRIWNIKSVNPTQLVLVSGYTEELWKFSTKLL
jgi:hypothetical protein